jgi:short-subunit dehydrogenase involved in D-alanine esterification of teichoic acids
VSGRDDAQQSTGGTTSVGQQLQQQFQERENEVAAQRTAFERRQKRRKVWSSRARGACNPMTADICITPAMTIMV